MDAMKTGLLVLLCCALVSLAFLPSGCINQDNIQPADLSGRVPLVRVLIVQGQSSIKLTAAQPPLIYLSSSPTPHRLAIGPGMPISMSLTSAGWKCGNL